MTYIGLAVMFLVADGKPYYLGGMFPLLLSAGAQPTMEWMRRQPRAAAERTRHCGGSTQPHRDPGSRCLSCQPGTGVTLPSSR